MLQIFSLLGLGFLLGLQHALDIDHVAAISTISSRSKSLKKAMISGFYWGIGHTSILFLTGIIILSFHWIIPEKIGNTLEILVGCMLIFLGFKNIFMNKKKLIHTSHHHHQSFWIGIVHGLAGSAALMLIILTTIKSTIIGLLYITIFGLGTICSMGCISFIMSTPSIFLAKKYPKILSGITTITGFASIFIGMKHIYTL